MSQVNFSTFSKDLNDAYNKVLSGDDSTDWAIFSYDKGGNDLKVTGSGDGGLEELQEEFEESKIQYAFVRVVEPISGLPKFVLISWCGDGVPVAKKGLFHYHVNDVTKYFKGFHVHINARGEGDVEPTLIMKKVRDSSGAKYSIHQEKGPAAMDIAPAPVGSNYVPVQTAPKSLYSAPAPAPAPVPAPRPTPSPAPASAPRPAAVPPRPSFSGPTGAPSVAARFAPAAAVSNDRVQAERERREREEREARERAEREAAEREARDRERERAAREETEQRLREQSEREERQRREQQERDAKAKAERQAREAEERDRRRKQEEEEERAAAAEAARATVPPTPARPDSSAGGLTAISLYDYAAEEANEVSLQEGERITNIVQLDEGWWQGTNSRGETGLFPANYVELEAGSAYAQPAPPPRIPTPEPEPEPEPVYDAPAPAQEAQAEEEEGAQAVALYEYVAAEENEVSFNEGDIITGITMVSEDWWQGYVNGKWGLFPGNYVELKQ